VARIWNLPNRVKADFFTNNLSFKVPIPKNEGGYGGNCLILRKLGGFFPLILRMSDFGLLPPIL
jgi:hypothetical protein